jgi:hypothetical protein
VELIIQGGVPMAEYSMQHAQQQLHKNKDLLFSSYGGVLWK